MSKVTLFISKTSNGSSPAFIASGDGIPGLPLVTIINIWGVFDGASVQLQFLRDGGNQASDSDWYSTGDAAITSSDSSAYSKLVANIAYRLAITNVGAITSIGATAYNATTY
jgi:hypothetical protein